MFSVCVNLADYPRGGGGAAAAGGERRLAPCSLDASRSRALGCFEHCLAARAVEARGWCGDQGSHGNSITRQQQQQQQIGK